MGLQRSDVLALIALLISLIALLTTFLQLLQQYFSTADGLRRCAESVMGKWAEWTRIIFRWKELRYEVLYETPVLFLAPPTNENGPLPGQKIMYMDGSSDSYKDTRTLKVIEQEAADKEARMNVHTADDERASWVTLLNSIQDEESESRKWDLSGRQANNFYPPSIDYTLVVGVQRKQKSWDFMPTAISRPFATTTISHLIEMVSMLGMFWKNFDHMNYNIRAEGNGFIITSTQVNGLGLLVVLSETARHKFQSLRPIPNEHARELSFGRVRIFWPNDEHPESLQFGSPEEMEQTLRLLGVQQENIKKYAIRHTHLFSIAFEIIGMLATPFRIRQSNFKRLPNPTTDRYNTGFSKPQELLGFQDRGGIPILMEEFQKKVQSLPDPTSATSSKRLVLDHWTKIQRYWHTDEPRFGVELREALHDALEVSTTHLKRQDHKAVIRVVSSHLNATISTLDFLESQFDSQFDELDASKEQLFMDHYFTVVRRAVSKSKTSNAINADDSDIWTGLMFRMLCWLLLHDFAAEDIKMVPSDLKGSRMPVYIG